VDQHKGLYFGTFDAKAPPLSEYLGEAAWYLDNFLQRNEGGIEILGGAQKWVLPCNWKFAAENFAGDAYHVQTSHYSGVVIGWDTAPTADVRSGGRIISPGNGHGMMCIHPDDLDGTGLPELIEYEKKIILEMQKRLGPRAEMVKPIMGNVLPNTAMMRGGWAAVAIRAASTSPDVAPRWRRRPPRLASPHFIDSHPAMRLLRNRSSLENSYRIG